MDITERIKKIVEYYDISIRNFEKTIGVSNNSIQVALKRKADIKISVANKILRAYPEIDPVWLLTGDGNMLKNAQSDTVVSEDEDKISDLRYIISLQKDKITRLENAVKQVEKAKRTTRKTV